MTDFVTLLKKIIDSQPIASIEVRNGIYSYVRKSYLKKLNDENLDENKIKKYINKLELAINKVELEYASIDEQIEALEKGITPHAEIENENSEIFLTEELKEDTNFNSNTVSNTKNNDLKHKWGIKTEETNKFSNYLITWWPFVALSIIFLLLAVYFITNLRNNNNSYEDDINDNSPVILAHNKNTYRLLANGTEENVPFSDIDNNLDNYNSTTDDTSVKLEENDSYVTANKSDASGQLESSIKGQISWSTAPNNEYDNYAAIIASINLDSLGEIGNITFGRKNNLNGEASYEMVLNFPEAEELGNGKIMAIGTPQGRLKSTVPPRFFIGTIKKENNNKFKFTFSNTESAQLSNLDLLVHMKILEIPITLEDNSSLLLIIDINKAQEILFENLIFSP
ncbi:hypothetical protein [Bartonella sp. DGB1]|uniref:hypothetical protein n=1 Tax=Bartonella sp. DGB1 TaxID=3239807 RepID=UPI0035238A93